MEQVNRELTDKNFVKRNIAPRPIDANKGTMGTLLSICGSYGMAGAAMLEAKAALRMGIGLHKCALPKSIYPIVTAQIPESVYIPLSETDYGQTSADAASFLLEEAKKCSAVVIGCGLSVCDDTKQLVNSIIENCTKPLLIDADALNCIAQNPEILKSAKAEIIITPHPGEFARLINSTAAKVNANRENYARKFALKYGVVTVLKGAGTVTASPEGKLLVNRTGNSGMATGGSGDVLAGMAGSLLAQGTKPFEAAAAAVYLHGLAGDIAAERLGKISMLPSDMIECIPEALRRCGLS